MIQGDILPENYVMYIHPGHPNASCALELEFQPFEKYEVN